MMYDINIVESERRPKRAKNKNFTGKVTVRLPDYW